MKKTEEVLEEVTKEVLARVKTWEDLYDFFETGMLRVRETGHPMLIFDVLYTMYSFMLAMKELPEEGDVQVLVKRMLRILLLESKEKLHAEVQVLSKKEAQEQLEKANAEVQDFGTYLSESYEEDGNNPKRKVTLH